MEEIAKPKQEHKEATTKQHTDHIENGNEM